jgi:hypothetical protein
VHSGGGGGGGVPVLKRAPLGKSAALSGVGPAHFGHSQVSVRIGAAVVDEAMQVGCQVQVHREQERIKVGLVNVAEQADQ